MTPSPSPSPSPSAALRSRHLELHVPAPQHLDALHQLLNDPTVAQQWRLSGRGIPLASLPKVLAEGVALSMVVHDAAIGQLIGLVEIVDLDEVNATAQLAVALDPRVHRSGLLLEALVLFLDEAFNRLTLRKVYAMMSTEVHESVAAGLGHLVRSGIVTHEGTLLAHRSFGGRWHDIVVIGIWPGPLRDALAPGGPLAPLAPDRWRLAA